MLFSIGYESQVEGLDLTSCLLSLSWGQKEDTVTEPAKALVPVLHLAVGTALWDLFFCVGKRRRRDIKGLAACGRVGVWLHSVDVKLELLVCPLPRVRDFPGPELCSLTFSGYPETWCQACLPALLCLFRDRSLWLVTDLPRPRLMIALIFNICVLFCFSS